MSTAARSLICIVGPTASGKSAVSELVAERTGGEIVSIDAMQIYRGMDIGTAKTPASARRVPLHMVDIVDVDDDYSVERFQDDARVVIDELIAAGKPPVLCGGTGLYLDAVIDEMVFPHGSRECESRARYEALAEELGAEGLHALLAERDPASAEIIHPNNVRRVVRALEMLDEGVSYASHHEGLLARAEHYPAQIWALAWPRDVLAERIARRVDAMFEQGLVDEVKGLIARGLTRDATAGQAIGYKEVLDYLDGTASLEETRELICARTRRYAKRQLSWLRRDGRVSWVDMTEHDAASAADAIVRTWEAR